jgi:hypothetical protein
MKFVDIVECGPRHVAVAPALILLEITASWPMAAQREPKRSGTPRRKPINPIHERGNLVAGPRDECVSRDISLEFEFRGVAEEVIGLGCVLPLIGHLA